MKDIALSCCVLMPVILAIIAIILALAIRLGNIPSPWAPDGHTSDPKPLALLVGLSSLGYALTAIATWALASWFSVLAAVVGVSAASFPLALARHLASLAPAKNSCHNCSLATSCGSQASAPQALCQSLKSSKS